MIGRHRIVRNSIASCIGFGQAWSLVVISTYMVMCRVFYICFFRVIPWLFEFVYTWVKLLSLDLGLLGIFIVLATCKHHRFNACDQMKEQGNSM